LLKKRDLFRKIYFNQEKYNGQTHIAKMIALLSFFSKELCDQKKEELD